MSGADAELSAKLFVEHHDRLRRFARQMVRNNADADDLVQETFLKVHDYLRNGHVIRAPLSFLFVTVRNLIYDGYRQKKIKLAEPAIDVDEVVAEGRALSAEQHVMSEQELEQLCAAINRLPERMRYAFVLRKVYGYSCQEIADRMGTSIETVKKQATLAFKRVQAQQQDVQEPKQAYGRATRSICKLETAPARHRE